MPPNLPCIGHEFVKAARPGALTAMAPYVRDLTIRYVPGVGHWSQQEAPDDLNPILAAWLADEAVPILPGDEPYREVPQERGIQA